MDDKELLNIFTDMVRAHTAYIDRQLSELGLSNGQGGVISALGRAGSLTQNALARFRQVTPATISIMLDRMERDGLVERFSPKENSRAKYVRLTEAGQALFVRLDALMNRQSDVVFAGLSQREKEQAAGLFKRLTANVVR